MPGRVNPRRSASASDDLPSLRRRSPLVYWVAVMVLCGLVATLLAGVLTAL